MRNGALNNVQIFCIPSLTTRLWIGRLPKDMPTSTVLSRFGHLIFRMQQDASSGRPFPWFRNVVAIAIHSSHVVMELRDSAKGRTAIRSEMCMCFLQCEINSTAHTLAGVRPSGIHLQVELPLNDCVPTVSPERGLHVVCKLLFCLRIHFWKPYRHMLNILLNVKKPIILVILEAAGRSDMVMQNNR